MVKAKTPKKNPLKRKDENTALIQLRIVDGTRNSPPNDTSILIRIRDGFQTRIHEKEYAGKTSTFRVPFHDNLQDRYTVLATSDNCFDIGFHPIHVTPSAPAMVGLMLLQKTARYEFAELATLKATHAEIWKLLSLGVGNEEATQRFNQLKNGNPTQQATLAALLNIAEAMDQLHLPQGTPLSYFAEALWDDSMQRDRFFGYADPGLIDQVRTAAQHGIFEMEPGPGIFHPGATLSYKEKRFGEANVQITFHEKDTKRISGKNLVKVEVDIDYFDDKGAHTLLEVIPNMLTHGKTDPKQVYVLRWVAGQQAGVPEFSPPYLIR